MAAFLGTNNIIYWRTNVETAEVIGDVSIGILDADLPPEVGFLPIVPTNLLSYLPTNGTSIVQGIGMNQDMRVFSQPMTFTTPSLVSWNSTLEIPFGLTTNWSVLIRGGDSSGPERLLIGNQFVLLSHNYSVNGGPCYSFYFDNINEQMHYLSTNNNVGTDYQLTPFALSNWTPINN